MNTEKINTAAAAEDGLLNIKIGTIAKIMRKFKISYGEYTNARALWQKKIHKERRGSALNDLTCGIIGAAAYLMFVGVFLVISYKAK